MTCNHCPKPCECGAEARYTLRSLRPESLGLSAAYPSLGSAWAAAKAHGPCIIEGIAAPQWPELEAMERALADYGEAA